MDCILIGISHKTAPVSIREKFSFTKKHLDESLVKLQYSGFIHGAVILSTCNRTEIYIDLTAEKKQSDLQAVKSFAFDIFNASRIDLERYFYIYEGLDVVRHLFRVASGLDSQVLGETQILGQVKFAWLAAYDKKVTSDELDRAFLKAQEVGKIVRSQTQISHGNISIGSIAIDMLIDRFNVLEGLSVLILGAGKICALVSKYLKDKNIRAIFVANRTYSRAQELANSCRGLAVEFSKLEEELSGVDIVISSTSSPHIILKKDMLTRIMRIRTKPLFIMDLALPRDVDPQIKEINGVSLYDLDDLKCVVDNNQKRKNAEAVIAEKIVERELNKFLSKQFEQVAGFGQLR
ncbi:MAG: glutamyl-tRNA reductase [Candidatus Omnitrophica bacterium]|nr:glutamyl-tRNA reductase [Candidatus Omnitrophota bacterium]